MSVTLETTKSAMHTSSAAVTPTVPTGGLGDPELGDAAPSLETAEPVTMDDAEDESQPSLADVMLGPDRERRREAARNQGVCGRLFGCMNKGDVSNVVTFVVMCIGLAMKASGSDRVATAYILGFGLFGFAGGITNWLAVKMLFDKIPYVIGSGVIPRQFKAIRQAVKDMIMKLFFEKAFLERYLNDRAKGLLGSMDLGGKLKDAMADPSFDAMMVEKLTVISTKPEGMLVQTMAPMFGGIELMVPMLKPFLGSFGEEMVGALVEKLDITEIVAVDKVIAEVDALLSEKVQLITPEMVKELMEEVIRVHLGWLVVWGNVFGGLIGVISCAVGYGA